MIFVLRKLTQGVKLLQTIGNRLKEIRESLGLSQEELGIKIGLTKSGVSGVEKNKSFMSKEVLSKLLLDLHVNLNWLLVGIGPIFLNGSQENDSKVKNFEEEIKAAGFEVDENGYLKKKNK